MTTPKETLEIIKQINTPLPGKTYPKFVGPLKFILMCGLDKPLYDNYCAKYKSGMLTPEEERAFKVIYLYVQQILADIEEKACSGLFNSHSMKLMLENWCPNGYAISPKKTERMESNIERYKQINKLKDESELKGE